MRTGFRRLTTALVAAAATFLLVHTPPAEAVTEGQSGPPVNCNMHWGTAQECTGQGPSE
ncbi:hypothetical protein GCM10022226_41060 [Sphaerisporangium flaviroseum]|uniref:Secreted protein n=1 Tax=Sphaerisporangium flaviroseum TaxID=509199 RepID=A0ABP7IDX9_9ACTN